jgi:acetolactate synthase-1/2/3 large subunit
MWTAQFFNWVHPRTHITSGGLGTMGFSLPAAMGACFGRKDLPVISISGDGGFQMNSQEMATIVEHKLPLKVFVINNGFLGMVRQWQELFWRRRYSHVGLSNPNFVKLAEAYGCPGYRVDHSSEVEDVIRKALAQKDGPVFVEFVVEKEDNVYPMIPSGQTVNELIDVPDLVGQPANGVPEETLMTLAKG